MSAKIVHQVVNILKKKKQLLYTQPMNYLLLSNKKEWTTDTHANTNNSQKYYAKLKMLATKLYALWHHLSNILEKEN